MAGRPRKPDDLKILTGTFRDDRSGSGASVEADGEPAPPKHLAGEALQFWKEIVPDLVAKGIAKRLDSTVLAIMCQWYARYLKYSKQLDKMKPADPDLFRQQLLAVGAFKQFDKIAGRFGITPSDRAKLRTSDKPKAGIMSRKRNA